MEPFETHKSSKFASEDFISSMPENVITNILDCLPIQNAVGTSILARNWRFKWTFLTQLVFDEKLFKYVTNLSRLLLHLKGPITKFVLYIPYSEAFDVEDINHWILFLSTKGIKEFVLTNMHETPLKLRTHLFSCLELTHLKLHNCCFHLPHSFSGFPNLLSLDMFLVIFESGNCGEVITQCPLLEILHMYISDKVKLAEIAKLENLKVLSLPLWKLDNIMITNSLLVQLGAYLPRLQELKLNFLNCKFLEEDGARNWVRSVVFPCLKTLALHSVDFSSHSMFSSSHEMIFGSPNLQSLTISAAYKDDVPPPSLISAKVDYKKMRKMPQLQLRYVFFVCSGSNNELWLINYILGCSPLLKKIVIDSSPLSNGKLILAKNLLMLHRASPRAEVEFL